ncbi:MAG: AEC family transporter, partial [Micrococcales bacterium]|nr:AEC family transporter [Micrococcales bacterium]
MTGALLGILVKTVACGGIGYGMRRRGAFDAGMADGFTALLLFIITPCVVLTTATSSHSPDLGGEILVGILIASLFLVCAMGLLQLVSRWLPLSVAHQRAFVNLCCLPNVGFIGIPITYELFGSPGVMVALVVNLVYNVISFTWGAWNFAGTARVRDLLANPSATISLLGLGLFFLNVRLPSVISSCLEMIGGTMTPVALFVVGISLAESRFGELVRNWWGYGVAGVRLLVLPLGLFGVLRVV